MTTKTTKADSGPAGQAKRIVDQNPQRRALTIRHVDSAQASAPVKFVPNADADADSAPLGALGAWWTFDDPTVGVSVFAAAAAVKLQIEESF